MSKQPVKTTSASEFEPNVVRRSVARAGAHAGHLIKRSIMRRLRGAPPNPASTKSLVTPFAVLTGKLATQPDTLLFAQMRLARDASNFWMSLLTSSIGNKPLQVAEPEPGDGRFRDQAWNETMAFNAIKQAYLLYNRWLMDTIDDVRGLDDHTRHKLHFFIGQMTDAMAPSNFILSNPEVLRATLKTRGRNLLRGMANLLRDLDEGEGPMPFRMSDPDAFAVGDNLANTPGDIIFQNDLMQLIQYRPTTESVHRRPLLVIPPWINKYYILDLGERKSFIRYWVEQGHTVFVVSWVNPGPELANKGFEDYMLEGPVAAMDAIERATGEREVNTVGYCIGGTLLGCTLAWLAARGDDRVKSATFLNSLMDFSDVGDLKVFIDEDAIRSIEKAMDKQGYLDGSSMAIAFNMLRANSLIWSFYINNYLLGRDTAPFDLLYWNCDTTRMPAAMHSFYLRNMYLENRLKEPGGIELAGTPIDLGKVTIPCYFASAIEDHIAPWTSCYRGSRNLGGPVRFVLGGSGHIAGIINPPDKKKYGYRVNEDTDLDTESWLKGAKQFEGSWWPDWVEWAEAFGGGEVKARTAEQGHLPVIEPAPGAYVKNLPAPPAPAIRKRPQRERKKATTQKAAPAKVTQ
ncbi:MULTISPECIES: PHA/PHB synthase family protein [Marinobacter]|uniref:Class I poly(R)-hydroxyalkanoic acid synthase n=1 Tax=Marinobacter suaedae TaxID=3057675 RepID=A0ABT8VX93_9GAMM|nr:MULTISPECIES: class I poly(R)-hydroxyalkanoic acid synthase [unclassified Marinobacter]MBZ2168742.1 class I poly(R)-hydroxyalkanoic acid synthase [Marinobacter sp. F4216]MDO3720619.1 class I poly(R)-hydroxyalkanoic acid synthase [Marinobacter sp. chi1]